MYLATLNSCLQATSLNLGAIYYSFKCASDNTAIKNQHQLVCIIIIHQSNLSSSFLQNYLININISILDKIGLNKYYLLFNPKTRSWQRVIFPGGGPPSIVTEVSLYDRVRDGNGCFPHSWPPASLLNGTYCTLKAA